jgi:chromosome partitioning protein
MLSTLGLKTCAIDLDIQANLTRQFDGIKANPPVFADLVDKKLKIEDIIIKLSPTLDIIPSSLKNGLIQKTLSHETPKHYLTWFNSLCLSYLRSKYDVIVVDTPPSLTTLNSVFCLCLQSTDNLLIPACADEFSIMGIEMFLEDVKTIRESYKTNSEPKTSILINKFFQNQTNNIEMFAKISKAYPNLLSKNVIKDCAKIRETTTDKKHIGDATRKSELFDVLVTLLNEFNILKKVK